MSDTMQIVSWALERSCPLRQGDAVHDVSKAGAAVGLAARYARSIANPDKRYGPFGDTFITGLTDLALPDRIRGDPRRQQSDPVRSQSRYPLYGFVLSEAFESVGGPDGLCAACRECPANTASPLPAGCVGSMFQNPWCGQTEEWLESIVSRLRLHDAIAEHLTTTKPIWFGLWTRPSPLPSALQLLIALIDQLIIETIDVAFPLRRAAFRQEAKNFLSAAKMALTGGLTLRVKMHPPGHADLGLHSTFPHCPLCKAQADIERWTTEYPVDPYTCKVCGTQYSPADTASRRRYSFTRAPDLREQLGDEAFRELARRYLVAQGMSEVDAREVVEQTEKERIGGL